MKAKVSLFHPVVQPDGSVIRRKIRNNSSDVVPDPIEHMWIEHYTDLFESGLFDLEQTCLELNLPLP